MGRLVAATAAGLLWMSATGAGAVSPGKLYEWLTPQDARALLSEAGAVKVGEPKTVGDEIDVEADFNDGLVVTWRGVACETVRNQQRCTEYEWLSGFDMEDAEAKRRAPGLQTYYVEANPGDDQLVLSRMELTYGKVTHEHVRRGLAAFLEVVRTLWDEIDPAGAAPDAGKTEGQTVGEPQPTA
jgi:hypothetical protein